MFKAVGFQVGATIIAAVIAAVAFGLRGAVSAALGGAACFVPNLVFALRLKALSSSPGASHGYVFLVGEVVKLVSIAGLLVAVHFLYGDLHWGALLIGVFLALQANFLVFGTRT
ncbi:MAG: ATP synthase subunit I [Sterolibacteriaceae bacterium]|uniref:ATP synthase subunit I n=1 Tax=Candidatus Methylophosphatis roskildensis TaxID=2899263 RepID=A0A9D7DX08_9PROT|nr:ATP synthase subunit I [Candidatus Methylophosphatis roskildensis]MBK7235104.1 ATP synthase subunit I [Sterolibacteriaceae bacterium]